VFNAAHSLAVSIYKETQNFPRDEWYGLRAQMRRAAVSIASNIVEGNARRSTLEYVHFVNVARGSAAELEYLVLLGSQLGYLQPDAADSLERTCSEIIPQLEALLQRMEAIAAEEGRIAGPKTRDSGPKTRD
jgi:four helix bundle protein